MMFSGRRAWINEFLKPVRSTYREVLLMSLFVNVLALAVPIFVLQVYDRVVFHAGITTLQGLFIGMILVLLFDYALKQSRARVMQTVALRIDAHLGRYLFDRLTALPLRVLEDRPAPHWQALFRDVDVIRNTMSGASALLLCDLPFIFLFFAVVFVIAEPIAWLLLIILPLYLLLAWRSGKVMSAANKTERSTSLNRDMLIGEIIAGRTTIKALALDRAIRPTFEERHADAIETAINRGSQTDGYANLTASLSMSTSILMTTVGAVAILNQDLTIGSLIATNMLSSRLLGPLSQLVNQWRVYASFLQSTDRLGETFAITSDRQVSEVALERPTGEITLEGVSFAYRSDSKPVIDGLKLRILPGGMSALVGRNGCGKTTLMKLILGLYRPTEGRVLLDGADIVQFTRAEIAQWIGYVPQETVLFAGTVRDNIAQGRPEATDAEIISASQRAGVHDFIIDLPDGYATQVGEFGHLLSGGQRQRLAIARALVGNPPVLLLDEPSGSLDRQAEEELRNSLKEIAKTRTILIITHSPILLQSCNNLVALDRGRIAIAGPTKEILPRLLRRRKTAASAAPDSAAPPTDPATATEPQSSLIPQSISNTQGSVPGATSAPKMRSS